MALNKNYWNYANAQSEDWISHGLKYANSAIYGNPNFTYGSLDLSFPTSFRRANITKIICSGVSNFSAESVSDCLIYNSMIQYRGNADTGAFYKDNIMTQIPQYGEGYNPVIDIDTHDFAFKMNLQLFSGGNWISVNAVDFVNNYASYAANVYGYIDNALMTDSNYYTFCNYYDTGDSIFSVKANNHGYRTTGYGDTNLGGHACSGTTTWSDKSIYQIATTTGWRRYTTNPGNFNMFIPYEIPEANGLTWTGNGGAPACLNTAGIYTNHALLRYTDQRVFMPLKHILRDIIVNCGLVLLDSTDTKWISMVDGNGLCQGKLVQLSSDEAKKSSIYNTRTSDNTLNPSPSPSGISDKELDMSTLMLSGSAGMVHYYEINKTGTATANQISDAISRFDISTIGKDLMRNMISFKAFAVLPTSSVFNNIIHVAGKDLKDENDNYLMGDVILGMSKLSLGTITIPTLYNDYRDYEPYTRIEMFVPFCGWFALPSWAMGKTITGEMFVDLYNGTCKAIIKASNTVVAEVGGNVAYDIPFVAESTGAKAGAVISSALTTAVATAGFTATPNIATGAAALSAAANLASAVNSNQTTLKGVLGDGSNVNGLNRCFIKVTRPNSPNGSTTIPDSYKHEIGVPTMKEIKISAGDGYIQVMDAKVTGTMTAREKQMIVDGFRHGLNF